MFALRLRAANSRRAATYKAQALPSNGALMLAESLVCDGVWVDHNTTSPLKTLVGLASAQNLTLAAVVDLAAIVVEPALSLITGVCPYPLFSGARVCFRSMH